MTASPEKTAKRDKLIKADADTHHSLTVLTQEWKAKSLKNALKAMCRYFEQHPVNPCQAKPLDVAEQLTELRNTVISYHNTNEKRNDDKLSKQMKEIRALGEEAVRIAKATEVSQKTVEGLAQKSSTNNDTLKNDFESFKDQLLLRLDQNSGKTELKETFMTIVETTFDSLDKYMDKSDYNEKLVKELRLNVRHKVEKL